jgi:hypothetical protein
LEIEASVCMRIETAINDVPGVKRLYTEIQQIPSCPPKSKRYLDGIVRVKRLAGFDYAEGDMN